MILLTVEKKDEGQRLDKYLMRYLPKAGTGFLYKMLRKKNITRNGKRADGNERLLGGDEIRLFLAEETLAKFRSDAETHVSEKKVTVLFENTDYLAVSKESGLLTQRDRSGEEALTDRVTGYLLANGSVTSDSLAFFRPSPANRLDRNTSGIVLFGKTLAGQQNLTEIIRERKVSKIYSALVYGHFPGKTEDCAWILKDREKNTSKIFTRKTEGAEEIRTDFEPVRYFRMKRLTDGSAAKKEEMEVTLLSVTLHTGRSHQIRARLGSMGYPVVGDPKYGDRSANAYFSRRCGLRSQLLHAGMMIFGDDETIPEALRGRTVKAPYPALFERILKELE